MNPTEERPRHYLTEREWRNDMQYMHCTCGVVIGPFHNAEYAEDAWIQHATPEPTGERIELPPILCGKLHNSKHWDAGIERSLAGERALRMEREDRLLSLTHRHKDALEALESLRVRHGALQRENTHLIDLLAKQEGRVVEVPEVSGWMDASMAVPYPDCLTVRVRASRLTPESFQSAAPDGEYDGFFDQEDGKWSCYTGPHDCEHLYGCSVAEWQPSSLAQDTKEDDESQSRVNYE